MFSWRKTRRKGLIQLSEAGAEGTCDSSPEISGVNTMEGKIHSYLKSSTDTGICGC